MSRRVKAIVQKDEAARFGSLAVDGGKVENGRVSGEHRVTSVEERFKGPGIRARWGVDDGKRKELAEERTRRWRRRKQACICCISFRSKEERDWTLLEGESNEWGKRRRGRKRQPQVNCQSV